MANETTAVVAATTATDGVKPPEKRPRSIFELPVNFFNSCRLLPPGNPRISAVLHPSAGDETLISDNNSSSSSSIMMSKWSCNTCKAEFESLIDQRSHFKSDFHRFNVKLSLAGKDTLKEDDVDELTSDSFPKDFDVSSISGSEDENDRAPRASNSSNETLFRSIKQKIFIRLNSGEKVSVWKSLILADSKTISCENDQFVVVDNNGIVPCLREVDVIEKLEVLTHETRDNTHLRIVLLASGGHFAGCVFDGNNVVAHKTFHRYVVRAKAGKTQSSKDGGGKSIHSAGASIRRYNELALKKNIHELLASWKPYFDASSCVFIYAPSSNRQMFYDGETPRFSNQHCDVKGIPFSVRRPTLKEARRIYGQLSMVNFEADEEELPDLRQLDINQCSTNDVKSVKENMKNEAKIINLPVVCETAQTSAEQFSSGERETEVISTTTPLHEAARSGNNEMILELLEQGSDPTVKDDRGRTPYMMATEKEVRNTFRRFMASNLEKWDWHAANVPSPLTKEMEESQVAKQAEKDAKRKAKAKELKKLRKEREKMAQAKAAESQNVRPVSQGNSGASSSNVRPLQSSSAPRLSKEEELKRKLIEDREKRAAAAERRMQMAASATGSTGTSQVTNNPIAPSTSRISSDIVCSCCNASLAGKVPFHRYTYKYCSTTCMNVHREFLEDG
ncbi:hypothetical protein vseg_018966 [Gypsophila vaccaria]